MITLGLLKLIGLTEEQYSGVVFNSGIKYAEQYYNDTDADTLLLITGCKAYWEWYKNQFRQKDEEFMYLHKNTRSNEKKLLELWLHSHEPEQLKAHPGSDIAYKALQPVWDEAINYKGLKSNSDEDI